MRDSARSATKAPKRLKEDRQAEFEAPRSWGYRAENIPAGSTAESLIDCFAEEDGRFLTVKSLAPAAGNSAGDDGGELTATLSFARAGARNRAPRLKPGKLISVDSGFLGLTPLNTPKHPATVDVIAVTGLAGHAYGSWTSHDDFMWLRDALPFDLPHARILVYGYQSELQNNDARSLVTDHAVSFLERVQAMRSTAGCENRPVVLIGHSLGCLIIKQALVDATLRAAKTKLLAFPVRCIVFLGAPHRGLHVKALKTLVKSRPSEDIVLELRSGSPTLTYLNNNFRQVVDGIRIISYYEKYPTATVIQRRGKWERNGPKVLMVPEDSAKLYLPNEIPLPAYANHSDIARFKRGEGSIYHTLKDGIRSSIGSHSVIVPKTSTMEEHPLFDSRQIPTDTAHLRDPNTTISASVFRSQPIGAIRQSPIKYNLSPMKAYPLISYRNSQARQV
ncbi:MAG: hypothetical protein Q9165_007887 [Trypethelium subeluteriae]